MRRAVVGTFAALAVMATAVGCSGSLSKRELVVHFLPTATPADHRAALTACTGVAPNTSPEPILVSHYASDRVGDVRFRIDHADDHDIAMLLTCLTKQRGVNGYNIPD